MEQISTDFRKEFNLPATEGVIQNYHCQHGLTGGTLYISQNFVCFSNGGSTVIKLPFGKIASITLQGLKGFRSIEIKTEGGGAQVHTFGLFAWPSHCKQAYTLMVHVWKNPPSYIDVAKIRSSVVETLDEKEAEGNGQMTQQRAKVDVDTARLILKTVVETDTMQNHAMGMLEEQAQTLDRIEGRLDHISSNLKKADVLMKGIESLPYYIFGASAKKEVLDTREKSLKDRTIRVPEHTPPLIEVEILYKGKDSLLPALIAFDVDKFKIVDPKTDKLLITGAVYSFTDIDSLLIRSRHEYMDIKLKKKEPIRLVSAYLQIITNQLHTRCQRVNHKLGVVFEAGAVKFDYQDEWLYKIPPPKRGQAPNVSGAFVPKISSLLTNEKQRRDMEEVEGIVDQATELVKGINRKGVETNKELARQIEQIKGMETKTDNLSGSIQNLNTRMDKVG